MICAACSYHRQANGTPIRRRLADPNAAITITITITIVDIRMRGGSLSDGRHGGGSGGGKGSHACRRRNGCKGMVGEVRGSGRARRRDGRR